MTDLTENAIEQNLIDLLKNQGYQYCHDSTIAPNAENPQREGFHSVVLEKQFKASLRKINPELPESARHEAFLHVLNLGSNDIMTNNEKFHLMLTNGVTVEYFKEGQSIGLQVKLIDFENPNNNDFWVVNQFVIQENNQSKRLDVVLFVNGLPLVVVELKSAISEKATLERAYTQIQNYKTAIPTIFFYNALCIISDGIDARISSVSAPFSRFLAWKSPQQEENGILPELQIMANEMLQKKVLLKLIRFNTVFEKSIELIPSLNPSHGEGEHYRGGMQFTGMIKQVRELRKKQTNAENIFWELVRNKKFCGLKFRRQHQIGHYIADFYCHSERLVIEFDGEVHCTAEQQKKDKKRDKYLTSLGNSVLRFNNNELFDNPAGVLQRIEKSLSPFGRDGREGSKPTIEGSTTQVVTIKKIAAYHQYYVVEKAIESTLRAINIKAPVGGNVTVLRENPAAYGLSSVKEQSKGDMKAGVVWHTQGSGKSLSMVFYAGQLVVEPAMKNPTIVILTDRNDLDDQLFATFGNCTSLLRQTPVQASSRADLKERLKVSGGGIIFTTIQKFYPEDDDATFEMLSMRGNIVVVADEAHRSQYGFTGRVDAKGNIKYGNAKYMRDALPNATYIGFTGTPIEKEDRDTQQVFGNYIDIYDIAQAVQDGATVPLSYESRLVKIRFNDEASQQIDELVDDIEGATDEQLEKGKKKNAQINAILGHPERLKDVAKDVVAHFEGRQSVFEGKGMIVCMTRQIAVDLYAQIIELKPEWHNNDLDKGAIKVVMTSSSDDPASFQPHNTNKKDRKLLAVRLKDSFNELKLVIVQSMWLTGFDAPPLHTLYIDKKMQGAALMQAIARVNRVYKDKPGGLIVDYIGIGQDLRSAMSLYTASGGQGRAVLDMEDVINAMQTKFEVVHQMFHGFDYENYFEAPTGEKLKTLLASQNFILRDEKLKERFVDEVTALSKLYVMAVPSFESEEIKDQVAFFQAIRSRINKFTPRGGKTDQQVESAIRQILDEALSSDGVVDIFEAAGINKPSLDILSEEFLLEVKNMEHENLAFELLKKLLNEEVKTRKKKNIVEGKKFSEMLSMALKRYHNNQIDTAQVIKELSDIAREMKLHDNKPKDLGLTPEEYAFYSILSQNSSTKFLEDHKMKELIHLIVDIVRKNATVDWDKRDDVKAKLRLLVKKVLMKYGYPPDVARIEADRVLKQSELLASEFTS